MRFTATRWDDKDEWWGYPLIIQDSQTDEQITIMCCDDDVEWLMSRLNATKEQPNDNDEKQV